VVSNILDESIEIDMETLMNKREENKEVLPFEGIECDRSLYVFEKKNRFRLFLYQIVFQSNNKFEHVIMVFILLSTIKLIVDTYLTGYDEDSSVTVISSFIDLAFTIVFALECIVKVIAQGFIQDEGSYLRETWSQLDFFIVITSLIDAALVSIDIPFIKVLRLLRILRPLRFISHSSEMKTVVVALLQSLFSILNVTIILGLIYLIFAIFFVNLYSGKF